MSLALADLVQSGRDLVGLSGRRERREHLFVVRFAPAPAAPSALVAHRHTGDRAACAAERGLRVRLRLSLAFAARRCSANLSVRHLAFQRAGRALGRHRCRALLCRPMGHRAARTGEDHAFGHGQKYFQLIVPLIVVAECCSWYAVISTDFLGNVLENSLWTVTFVLIAIALFRLLFSFRGLAQFAVAATAAGVACYVIFMSTVDVPMYVARWQAELADGAPLLGLLPGLYDLATRWIVTHDIASGGRKFPGCRFISAPRCGRSLLLGGFSLVKNHLPRYRVRRPLRKPVRRPLGRPGPHLLSTDSSIPSGQIRRAIKIGSPPQIK